eukprot:Opistho-2@57380
MQLRQGAGVRKRKADDSDVDIDIETVSNSTGSRETSPIGKRTRRSSGSRAKENDVEDIELAIALSQSLHETSGKSPRASEKSPRGPKVSAATTTPPRKKKIKDEEAPAVCGFCLGNESSNKKQEPEEMIHCSTCPNMGHPSCLQFSKSLAARVKTYPWQCMHCKICCLCTKAGNDSRLLLCDECDKGFHTFCLKPPLTTMPKGAWVCEHCVIESGLSREAAVKKAAAALARANASDSDATATVKGAKVAVRGRGRPKRKAESSDDSDANDDETLKRAAAVAVASRRGRKAKVAKVETDSYDDDLASESESENDSDNSNVDDGGEEQEVAPPPPRRRGRPTKNKAAVPAEPRVRARKPGKEPEPRRASASVAAEMDLSDQPTSEDVALFQAAQERANAALRRDLSAFMPDDASAGHVGGEHGVGEHG